MFKNKKWLYILYTLIFILAYLILGYNSRIFNDYLWHIKAGEWMVQNKEILTHNIFSYIISEDTIWYSHEWLSEILMYLSLKLFKIDFAYFVITIILTVSTLLFVIKKDLMNKDLLSTIFITVMIFITLSSSLYARPFILGILFFILLMKALDNIKYNRDSKLYLYLPLISILWANIHGGTIIFAILAPLGYYICGKFRFLTKRFYSIRSTKSQEKKYIYVLIGNFIGSLINPLVYNIYLFPLYINNETSKANILEWSPAQIRWPSAIFTIIFIVLFLIVTSKKINFTDFAVVGSLIMLTLVYGRFYSWLCVAFLVIFTKYFPKKKNDKYLEEFSFEIKAFLIVFIGLFIFIVLNKPLPKPVNFMNPEIIETLKEIKPERLFNSYNAGGALNYYGEKCFINSIAELYEDNELNTGKYLEELNIDIYKVVDYYEFDTFLVEKNNLLYKFLKANKDNYELVYEDSDELINDYIYLYSIFKVKE